VNHRKKQRIRFMREIVPAQRKLAKLCRPGTTLPREMSKGLKDFLRTKVTEELEQEAMARMKKVQLQYHQEKERVRQRKETQRAQHLATFRRPISAKELERANMPLKEERNGTDVLIETVQRNKRRSKSAKRQRTKSQKHAKMFSSANNATSRHIARGNLIRRKKQLELATKRRVAQTRTNSTNRQAIMREAAVRKQKQQQKKILRAREEYKQMLIWRRNVDVQKLEMARLRKEYHKDLKQLVQKVQRGELDQPIWDMHQPPHELMERATATQNMVPVRPKSRSHNGGGYGGGRGFGAYNGGPSDRPEQVVSNDTVVSEISATFSAGPTMEKTVDLKMIK